MFRILSKIVNRLFKLFISLDLLCQKKPLQFLPPKLPVFEPDLIVPDIEVLEVIEMNLKYDILHNLR